MNRILSLALLIILSGLFCFFMFLASFSFANRESIVLKVTEENKWYLATPAGSGDTSIVSYVPIDDPKKSIVKNSIVFGELGRLSSFMYLSQSGSFSPPITLSGTTDLEVSNVQGILSLYDLFSTYSLHSQSGSFRLDQITNGSFYIGNESDGKVVIYAIDGVGRLVFLSGWKEMTNMMLFPGSYIRFDPKRNSALNGADLFRTILSLQEWENEIFEFVNPRVNTGNDKDTFFNYRLPLETKWLFRTLSARFHEQVESVDLLKSYGVWSNTNATVASDWLFNPSKKNHIMLLELKDLLSQVIRTKKDKKSIVRRIWEIYQNAKALNMESSSAKKTIEKFLLDGRFALYGNISDIDDGYQETYENIAKLIGIEKTGWKSKLFQNLADIYSGNLFLQMGKTTTFKIDTFEPTATTLRSTIDEPWIDEKDFFDIAIYSYNIIDKIQDKGILTREYLENKSTFDYLITFFYAGNKYMNSIDDIGKRSETILSFSSQFYEKVLTLVVRSLYNMLMVDDNGALYLNNAFVDGTNIKLDTDFMRQIFRLNSVISYVNDSIVSANNGAWNVTDVYTRIQKSTLRLNALATLLDPEKYNTNYVLYSDLPFATELEDGVAVPKVDLEKNEITKFIKPVEVYTGSTSLLNNEKVVVLRWLFPDSDITSFIPDGEFMTVKNALWTVKKNDGTDAQCYWTLTYLDEKNISQIFLQYNSRSLEIKLPNQNIDLETFKLLKNTTLKPYLDILDSNSDISGDVRILLGYKRLDIGEQTYRIQE